MSLEAIQTITGAEQAVREQKARGAHRASPYEAGEGSAGRPHGPAASAPAADTGQALQPAAAPRAGEHSAQTLGDSAAQCESLKQAARGRLEQAAGLIVGRVGNS